MNDYSTLDELFDIYNEPATESLEMMAATTVARVGGAGIAHMVHTIDADKAGQLTNDELRELKEAAKWCRSKFKSMAPDIVKDRLNKGIVKLGKNDKILKSNIAAFDYNAIITDDKMRNEHWAPVVTMVSDISNTTGGFTDYGYDFYKLIKDELEKKYPNCEMSSMEVGKYIYVLKYKKSKAAKEGAAMEGLFDKFRKSKKPTKRLFTDKDVASIRDIEDCILKTYNQNVKSVADKYGVKPSVYKLAGEIRSHDASNDARYNFEESVSDEYIYMSVAYYDERDVYSRDEFDKILTSNGTSDGAKGFMELMKIIESEINKSGMNIKLETEPDRYEWSCSIRYYPTGDVAKESAIGGDETMNDLFEGLFEMSEDAYADPAFESIATNLRRDYQEDPEEPISLKSMYCVHMNDDALKKYQEEYDQLKKVDKNAEKLRGCMYFWQKELAAFISIDIRSDKVWIDTLEVVKKFRGKKLSFQLLDVAVRKFHATDLKVHIDNKKAIGIFKTYGFKTYDKKNNWLYMTLRDDVKDIDEKHTEDVKPVDKGTKTDDIQEAKEGALEPANEVLSIVGAAAAGTAIGAGIAKATGEISYKAIGSKNKKDHRRMAASRGPLDDKELAQLKRCAAECKSVTDRLIDDAVERLCKKDKAFEKLRGKITATSHCDDNTARNTHTIPIVKYVTGITGLYATKLDNVLGEVFRNLKARVDTDKYNCIIELALYDGIAITLRYRKAKSIKTANESAAMEATFNNAADSTKVEKLLANTEPTLRRQLTTIEDCDKYLEIIKNESTKFNEAANAIISAYSKYESGEKTKEDTKEFNKTVAAGKKLLNDNCRKLNVRLGKLVGDNDHISRQDVKNFAQYISGLRKIVNSIKRDLSKKNSER